MSLGSNLSDARKKKSLSQEAVAEKLGVSRQTISKWETDETLPDIRQSKHLALLYGLTLDELLAFDLEVQEIQEVIDRTREEVSDKIDWTKAWSKKYPVLAQYQTRVDAAPYAAEMSPNRFGIPEPAAGDEPCEIAVVPLLAVDGQGYRLGYGGGYYDRYFAAHPDTLRVGFCYAGQAVGRLPRSEYDVPLHAAVTETGVTRFARK